ncbi:MAG: cytochrome c3 family protein, partial [Desulfobacterales bacterium]|nr:cytochrome c3 family protein [Desulfobacterales bacterium]
KGVAKSDSTCKVCHMTPTGAAEGSPPAAPKEMAEALLASRSPMIDSYEKSEIPEKVVIKALSEEYEPAEMPHRKIVTKLIDDLRNDKIAAYFHLDKGAVCQGCHHNSPATEKPPQCGSCHGKPFRQNDLFKPGLKAAYHQQCMKCHAVMEIAKPDSRDCGGCHVKKKKS